MRKGFIYWIEEIEVSYLPSELEIPVRWYLGVEDDTPELNKLQQRNG